ncbi:MAG: hypothetical protein WBP61_17915 [Nocardioides sp.]
MRLSRIVAAALATVLVAPTAMLTTAGPAGAATPTKIVGGTDGKSWIYTSSYRSQPGPPRYGDKLSLSINVETEAGQQVYDGSLTVQRKLPGKAWKTIKKSTSAYLYDSVKAAGNATYRVLYSGSGDYSPSTAGATSKVQRKIEIKNAGTRKVILSGKVSPKYKGKVAIFKKNGKKWKKFKTVRTNKKSKFRTPLPAPRKGKYFWNVKIGGSKKFAPSQTGKFYTYSYRQAADRRMSGL